MSQVSLVSAVSQDNRNTLVVFVVVVMIVLFIITYSRSIARALYGDTITNKTEEKYVGNVGNQGMFNVNREPSKKQLACYNDMDCPDETYCNDKGMCVPLIHELPQSRHLLKFGRGREKEKSV